MRVCLYEDRRAADLDPLTATRPPSDLICGLTTLGEKQAAHFAAETVGFLGRPVIADLVRERSPLTPANDPGWLRAARFRRRSRSGRRVSGRPSTSASRSKRIRSAGVSAASFCIRLVAGVRVGAHPVRVGITGRLGA